MMSKHPKTLFDPANTEHISILDETPLWSAPFGLVLLQNITMRRSMKVLDLGCGTGFPLIELSQRLGNSSHITGIDPWKDAIERCELKKSLIGISNIMLINNKFENVLFEDDTFDLIVSNNGISNMENQHDIYRECWRIMKKDGEFAFTFNLPGTMKEFYSCFKGVLRDLNMSQIIPKVDEHIQIKRKSIDETKNTLESAGFHIKDIIEDIFYLRYADGSAMLDNFFIKLAFIDSWKSLLSQNEVSIVFDILEKRLNAIAEKKSELCLSIPFAFFKCIKS